MRYNGDMAETFYVAPIDSLARSVRKILFIVCGLTGVITLLASIFYFIAQPIIPILYSLPRPEQALAPKLWIFVFPVMSLVLSIVHIILIGRFKDLDEFILKMFAWVTVFMQLFIAALLVRIIYIIW